jgi:hypothetical protein
MSCNLASQSYAIGLIRSSRSESPSTGVALRTSVPEMVHGKHFVLFDPQNPTHPLTHTKKAPQRKALQRMMLQRFLRSGGGGTRTPKGD